MLGAMIVVFREVLEAGLIVGIVLAATAGVPRRGWWVAIGILGGAVGAAAMAIAAGAISRLFQGSGAELLNAAISLSAVVLLASHNIWMARHGREMAAEAKNLGRDVVSGEKNLLALALVVALAILREGSEVVLFLYGMAAAATETWQTIAFGGLWGLALGAFASLLLFYGLVAIPVRYFFTATTALITLLAAGLAAQGALFLSQAGYLDTWSTPLWNSEMILSESGWLGRIAHTLVGYSDRPTGMQLIFYFATCATIVALMKKFQPAARPTAKTSVA